MKLFGPLTKAAARRHAALMALALAILLAGSALGARAAEQQAVPYAAIYGADNPIPGIAQRVRPAVVQVINIIQTWTPADGAQSSDQGYGSGVYIDDRGYVVTNYHVIAGADVLEIEALDGRRIGCALAGYDDGTDIAVLKLNEPLDAQAVPMGDSEALQIGELAIAIGNPGVADAVLFGTVTAGIISALDREDISEENFRRRVSVIQTDAAINAGNSGGALLNARGELIGIPTLKYMFDYDTVYEGLGFAIPINVARPVIEQLIATGKVVRPRLGIIVENFEGPNEPARRFPPAGARVVDVEPAGAAAQAGLLPLDIITAIDGVRVKTTTDLIAEIDRHAAGERVRISVYRCFNPFDMSLIESPESLEFEIELRLLD